MTSMLPTESTTLSYIASVETKSADKIINNL